MISVKHQGWEVGIAEVGGVVGGKWRQLYLNNNKKSEKKLKEKHKNTPLL